MTDLEHIVTRLAVLTALEGRIAAAKKAAKAELSAGLSRGTVHAFDGLGITDDHLLGRANVPKPPQPKPVVAIDDEARVLPWAIDAFGDSAATFRLTEQGRKSVTEYVLAQHRAAGSPEAFELDGVTVTVPPARDPSPSFTASKNVDDLVEAMFRDGRLAIADVLALTPAN